MIKKDIVRYAEHTTASSNATVNSKATRSPISHVPISHPMTDIDQIFADADRDVAEYANKSTIVKNKKEKKKKSLLRRIIEKAVLVFLILALIVASAIAIGIWQFQETFPEMKAGLLAQYDQMQNELSNMNESEMTAEQLYQKRVLMLFSTEELDDMISDMFDLKTFQDMLNGKDVSGSFIPQEKVDEYNRLMEEYEKAKAEEDASKSNNQESNADEAN